MGYFIRQQIFCKHPSNWKPTDDVGIGNISFGLPDEESSRPGLFDFMRPEEEERPVSFEDILFVEVVPLSNAVSESAFLDEFIPLWLSSMKDNLTNFSLIKSKAYTLDDSPAQILEYSYADEVLPSIEQKALSIFTVEDNILYRIGYQPWRTTSYYDNIPIIREMIESFAHFHILLEYLQNICKARSSLFGTMVIAIQPILFTPGGHH